MENEEKLNSGINGETETPNVENVEEETPATNETQENPNENGVSQQEPNTFTQEQVNDFVRNRLSKLYSNYGVQNKEELDGLVEKSRSYETMKEDYDKTMTENQELKSQLMFNKSRVREEKIDDIKTYFKGKGLELNEENFASALETHPEWIKQANVEPIGTPIIEDKKLTQKELASKIYGYNL